MKSALKTLAERYGGDVFAPQAEDTARGLISDPTQELLTLLKMKNGFLAFESALHIYPLDDVGQGSVELLHWNEPETWKSAFDMDLTGVFCFAENILGEQFAIVDEKICRFDPETGECEAVCETLEDWAQALIENPDRLLLHSLGHDWQVANGALGIGQRLVPKIPFVCGGDFKVSNLYSIESVRGMRFRGGIANQISNLPDGTVIRFDIEGR